MASEYIGEIRMLSGKSVPNGWALCNGATLQISQYQALFSLIGNIYGGDGAKTFALPNLQGRLPVGYGSAPHLSPRSIGAMFGSEELSLTTAQIPSHSHSFRASSATAVSESPVGNLIATPDSGPGNAPYRQFAPMHAADGLLTFDKSAVTSTGSGAPHPNLMPALAFNFIIALQGIYPDRPAPGAVVSSVSMTSGRAVGGDKVTISGSGFLNATTVLFGAGSGTFKVLSDTALLVTTPPGQGKVSVVVGTPLGWSSGVVLFTYTPSITALSPSSGPSTGGTAVTVTGWGLTGTTEVKFGDRAATNLSVVNDTQLTLRSPSGSGSVGITAITPNGSSVPAANVQFDYAPQLFRLAPTVGAATGGTKVKLSGHNFTDGAVVSFGNVVASQVTVVSSDQLEVVAPAGTGVVPVTVTTANGTSLIDDNTEFNYGPSVSNVSPSFGPLGGGTVVTLTGENFASGATVQFGTAAGSNVQVSGNKLTVVAPAGTGSVPVSVTVNNVTSPASQQGTFDYGPRITSISPDSGPPSGGNTVTIRGTNFDGSETVMFGTAKATITLATTIFLQVTAPPGTGTEEIVVTGLGGSTKTHSGRAEYAYEPVVYSVDPRHGSGAGGTVVYILGSNLSAVTAIHFGSAVGKLISVESDTKLSVLAPAGNGVVDVTVTSAGGTTVPVLEARFSYDPSVTSFTPTSGSPAGGTAVTITGLNFTDPASVHFGSTDATNVVVTSPTTITATSPPGDKQVQVRVITASGSSHRINQQFEYLPAVDSLHPDSGLSAGGTAVTLKGKGFTGATSVLFGTSAVVPTVVSDTEITATAPAGTGYVYVTVVTPSGTSVARPANQFGYGAWVSKVTPDHGSPAGGTDVTIHGQNFGGTPIVNFGKTAATDVELVSANEITCVAPAGTGIVEVTVSVDGAPSSQAYRGYFRYAPSIDTMNPDRGMPAGGTPVLLTGTNFTKAATVTFGDTPALSCQYVAPRTLVAVCPPGKGHVVVHITDAGGTSESRATFSYTPHITELTPKYGSANCTVLISGVNFDATSTVTFDWVPATNVEYHADEGYISCLAPEGRSYAYVRVTASGGESSPNEASRFWYRHKDGGN
jgi:microcystin-dependent protein